MGFSFRNLFNDKAEGAAENPMQGGGPLPPANGGGNGRNALPPQAVPGGGVSPAPANGAPPFDPQPTGRGSFEEMFAAGKRAPGAAAGAAPIPFGAAAPEQAGPSAVYSIGDLLQFVPPALATRETVSPEQPVQVELPADGSRDVKLSTLYKSCPQLFATEITPLNDSQLTLPDTIGAAASAAEVSPFGAPSISHQAQPEVQGQAQPSAPVDPFSQPQAEAEFPSVAPAANPFDPNSGGGAATSSSAGVAPQQASMSPMSWHQPESHAQETAGPSSIPPTAAAPQQQNGGPSSVGVNPFDPNPVSSPPAQASAPQPAPVPQSASAPVPIPAEPIEVAPEAPNIGEANGFPAANDAPAGAFGGDVAEAVDDMPSPFSLEEDSEDNPFFLADEDDEADFGAMATQAVEEAPVEPNAANPSALASPVDSGFAETPVTQQPTSQPQMPVEELLPESPPQQEVPAQAHESVFTQPPAEPEVAENIVAAQPPSEPDQISGSDLSQPVVEPGPTRHSIFDQPATESAMEATAAASPFEEADEPTASAPEPETVPESAPIPAEPSQATASIQLPWVDTPVVEPAVEPEVKSVEALVSPMTEPPVVESPSVPAASGWGSPKEAAPVESELAPEVELSGQSLPSFAAAEMPNIEAPTAAAESAQSFAEIFPPTESHAEAEASVESEVPAEPEAEAEAEVVVELGSSTPPPLSDAFAAAMSVSPGLEEPALATEPEIAPEPELSAEPEVAPEPEVQEQAEPEDTIKFPLIELLGGHSAETLGFSPKSIPDGAVAELPFSRIESQLSTGRVAVSVGELAAAAGLEHGAILARGNQAAEVDIPQNVLFHHLSDTAPVSEVIEEPVVSEPVDSLPPVQSAPVVPPATDADAENVEAIAPAKAAGDDAFFPAPADLADGDLPPSGASVGFSTPFSSFAKNDEFLAAPPTTTSGLFGTEVKSETVEDSDDAETLPVEEPSVAEALSAPEEKSDESAPAPVDWMKSIPGPLKGFAPTPATASDMIENRATIKRSRGKSIE